MNADLTVVSKPHRKPASSSALQFHLQKYAASGPDCPNGHPWSTNARFNYRGNRSCDTCLRAKAAARRNDPATYTGACPLGHEYTRENTVITNQNSKLCLTCRRVNFNKGRSVSPEQMQRVLAKARDGATASVILGNKKSLGKKTGIIDRPTLLNLLKLQTPDCQELKQLLDKNSFRGRQPYRWTSETRSLLAEEAARSSTFEDITILLNGRFNTDFSVGAVRAQAGKLALVRPRRVIIPRLPKLPPLVTALHFPVGSLLDRINAVVPRHLPRDHRDDVIAEMVLAIYEGKLEEIDIGRRVREFVNAGYRRDHDRYGPVSLDQPIYEDSPIRLIDKISTGMWQSEASPDFQTHDEL